MKEATAIKPLESHTRVPDAELHGIGPNRYLKLVYRGKKYIGVGKLLVEEQKTGVDGRISTFCRLVHETPTELAQPQRQPISIACIGVHDQKRYRFRGLLRSKKRDATHSPVNADPATAAKPLSVESLSVSSVAGKSSPAEGHDETPQRAVSASVTEIEKPPPTTRTKVRSRPHGTEAAIAELKWVTAMIEAGIDSNIKLSTICLLTDKSRATLERELAQGRLPPPRIKGRLRYWSLNDVNAYMTGTWPAIPAL